MLNTMASNSEPKSEDIPRIDISSYLTNPTSAKAQDTIRKIHKAACTWGFFLLTGTAVTSEKQEKLLQSAKDFFDLPLEKKSELDVKEGGPAWRGYMPLGGEHTHGRKDFKEGLYIGPEHPDDHPLIGMPLHGRNRFPDDALPEMRDVVMEYLDQATELGKTLTDVFSLGLGLDKGELRKRWLQPEPVVLFRCFKYVPLTTGDSTAAGDEKRYGIGEHTDFGYLTILKVDSPGLQIQSPSNNWVDVPVIKDAFVVNVGDMFDQLTHGRYRSRPHRVLRPSPGSPPRYAFPLFFDFAWDAKMERLPQDSLPAMPVEEEAQAKDRWASTTFRDVKGCWWQYLARKVQKVFPDLNLPDFEPNSAPSTRFTREVKT